MDMFLLTILDEKKQHRRYVVLGASLRKNGSKDTFYWPVRLEYRMGDESRICYLPVWSLCAPGVARKQL